MRVLVTGATGFIGYEVAVLLARRGLKPRLLVRRPERGLLLNRLDARLVHGDLTRPASLARAVEGADAVIHLAARATFEDYGLLRPTIVDGSLALMEAAAAAGVKRFVYGSSLLVYGDHAQPIDETTPADPRIGYGRAKLEAERGLEDLAAQSGLSLVSVRLPHVYGARNLMFSQMARGRLVVPGAGRNVFSHLHVEDAARLLVGAAEQSLAGAVPRGDDRPASWDEFFETVMEFYPRFRTLRVPTWFARLGTEALRPLQYLRRRPTLATRGTVIGWNLNVPVRPRVLWDELGMTPTYPTIARGIPAALDERVAYRWLHPVEDGAGW